MSTTVAKPKKRVITRKELAKQKVLIAWSAVFVIYGFIFCYLPLAGWLMAFENYKNKTKESLRVFLKELINSNFCFLMLHSLGLSETPSVWVL